MKTTEKRHVSRILRASGVAESVIEQALNGHHKVTVRVPRDVVKKLAAVIAAEGRAVVVKGRRRWKVYRLDGHRNVQKGMHKTNRKRAKAPAPVKP